MSNAWRHRTNTGRVVYNRRKSYFRARDVRRIAKAAIANLASGVLYDDEEQKTEANEMMKIMTAIFTEMYFTRILDPQEMVIYILDTFDNLGIKSVGFVKV